MKYKTLVFFLIVFFSFQAFPEAQSKSLAFSQTEISSYKEASVPENDKASHRTLTQTSRQVEAVKVAQVSSRISNKNQELEQVKAHTKNLSKPSSKKQLGLESPSFKPLLIQGSKKIKNNINNIKVDIDSLSETEVFFIETDFKKRIFSDEGHF